MLWSRPANMSGEIDLQWLLTVMPPAEATLCRALIQLLASPSPEAPNRGGRQIEMALLAKLTGFSKRWVIELMQRLEKKNFIRTDGGSGAVKWIWLLPLGVPRLGRPFPPELPKKGAPRPGKAKAPRAATSQSKRRRKETTPSSKPGAEGNDAPPVAKPAAIPERRRKGPIPPVGPAPYNPVVLATVLIPPPPPHAPANPMLSAAMMPPPPPATPPGGPAPDNPVVAVTTVTPAPSRARRGSASRNPRVRATKIAPPPSTAPGDLTGGNVVVPTTRVPPTPSAASVSPLAGNPMRTAKVAPPPALGNPVVPAVGVTPPPTPEPAAPAAPTKRVSPRKSTKKLPAGHSHWEIAPIQEMVAYACSLSVTPELIRSLKTPGMSGGLLVLALERLCQRIERYGLMPYTDRSSLVTALRTIVSDL
jgi:hypothetical protein